MKVKLCKKEKLLSISELCQYLNTKEGWVRMRVFQKSIPFLKVGFHIRFDINEIDEWIKKETIKCFEN
ncbi:MAG: excisionase family DNA-binding protein [Halobacteriovoraceae bacterium]|nr:excisionase family DNA-binding protein [Halobacteriovoraceae bacterium]